MISNQLAFVLVQPEDERNVGAVARALNTMGHSCLYLVDPKCNHLSGGAYALAHASSDLLIQAEIFPSLSAVRKKFDIMVAATARHRKRKYSYLSPTELVDLLKSPQMSSSTLGIVFGPESSGLSNQDLECCDLISTIPQATLYPSLNLSQAVMIYSYELAKAGNSEVKTKDRRLITDQISDLQYSALKDAALGLLKDLKLKDSDVKTILSRLALMQAQDLALTHNLIKKIISFNSKN